MSIDLQHPGYGPPLIPGAYERNALPYRQSGSIRPDVSVAAPIGARSMDAATIAEREREGGGAPSERRRKVQVQPQAGPALRGTGESSWLRGGYLWFQILRLARR
jgi:hypothetical protein